MGQYRLGVLVVLAIALVLSGCSSFERQAGEGPGATETATATPVPTERPLALPAAIKADGSVNETKLLGTFGAAMNESGVKATHERNGSTTVAYMRGNESFVREDGGTSWERGPVTATNDTLLGDYDYRVEYDGGSGESLTTTGGIGFGLSIRLGWAEYQHVGTTRVDGTLYHELKLASSKVSIGYYTGTALVDQRGRLHSLTGRIGDNESVAERYRFEIDWSISDVPRPTWLDEVHRGTARYTNNGTVFAVTVTDGPPIPAGTQFDFENGTTYTSGTIEAPLAPGETLYLAINESTDGDRSLVSSRTPIDRSDLIHLEGTSTRFKASTTVADNRTIDLFFVRDNVI